MVLPTNVDATYADSGTDASQSLHQQHHDTIHDAVNAIDAAYADAVAGGFVGTKQAWLEQIGAAGGGGGSVATDAIFDAKGDLPVGTGADTAVRLPVGTDGDVLTADAAEASGVKWAPGGGGITDAGGSVTIAHIWSGSQAEYDALGSYDGDTLYFTPEA